jgi:cell division protein FtsW
MRRKPDKLLLGVTFGLVFIGMLMILSSSSYIGYANYADSYYFIKKHSMYLLIGLVAMTIGWRIPYSRYQSWLLPGFVASLILVFLTLIPGVGVKTLGASRWLQLGPITIQPVEMMKFAIFVYLAHFLQTKKDHIGSITKGLIPLFSVILIPALLIAKQPDLGNDILIFVVTLCLIFISGAKIKHLATMALAGISAVSFSILLHPYQLQRIKTFLDPFSDPLGKSYHIIQSFIAIGSGGIFGSGLGQSKLKYHYLPLQYSDFIFSILCEEGGLILAGIVLTLIGLMLRQGLRIANNAPDAFGRYLATGLTLQLVLQSLINIAVVTGVFPTKGIPLAFISFGGTSLVMGLFYVGVLINIGMGQHDKKEPPSPRGSGA